GKTKCVVSMISGCRRVPLCGAMPLYGHLVNFSRPSGYDFPVEFRFYPCPSVLAEIFAVCWRIEQTFHCFGQGSRLARRHEEPILSVPDEIWQASHVCRYQWFACRHGFHRGKTCRFDEGRHDHEIAAGIKAGHIRVFDPAQWTEALLEPRLSD